METKNQGIGFFQKSRFSPVAAVVLVLLWALFCRSSASWVIMPIVMLSMPAVLLMLPAYLCYTGARAGRLPALFCLLLGLTQAFVMAGWPGLLCIGLLLLPACALSVYTQDTKKPFWPSVLMAVAALFAGALAVVLVALLWMGGDLVTGITAFFRNQLQTHPWAEQSLYTLYVSRLVDLPEGMALLSANNVMMPEAKEQLINSALLQLESLRLTLPAEIASASVLGGVLCVALPRFVSRSRMEDTDPAPLPSFGTWALPEPIGRLSAVVLLVVGALRLMSQGSGVFGAYNTLWAFLRVILMLQGASTVYYLLKRSGTTRRSGRFLWIVVLWVWLDFVLWGVGCADPFFDLRGLRPSTGEKEEDDK